MTRRTVGFLFLVLTNILSANPVAFKKIVLTDQYLCDGISAGDFNHDGWPKRSTGLRKVFYQLDSISERIEDMTTQPVRQRIRFDDAGVRRFQPVAQNGEITHFQRRVRFLRRMKIRIDRDMNLPLPQRKPGDRKVRDR